MSREWGSFLTNTPMRFLKPRNEKIVSLFLLFADTSRNTNSSTNTNFWDSWVRILFFSSDLRATFRTILFKMLVFLKNFLIFSKLKENVLKLSLAGIRHSNWNKWKWLQFYLPKILKIWEISKIGDQCISLSDMLQNSFSHIRKGPIQK